MRAHVVVKQCEYPGWIERCFISKVYLAIFIILTLYHKQFIPSCSWPVGFSAGIAIIVDPGVK